VRLNASASHHAHKKNQIEGISLIEKTRPLWQVRRTLMA